MQVVFKMDRYGNGEEVLLDKVFESGDGKPSFINFSKDLFAGELHILHPTS